MLSVNVLGARALVHLTDVNQIQSLFGFIETSMTI